MVKRKEKPLLGTSKVSNNDPKTDLDLFGDDSWVIVKKQRITILIPPLPEAKQATALDPEASQLTVVPKKTVKNQSRVSPKTHYPRHSVDRLEKPVSLTPVISPQIARKVRSSQVISKRVNETRPRPRPGIGCQIQDQPCEMNNAFKALKATERFKLNGRPLCPLNSSLLLNQMMRASNLERKIRKAGGLSRWLASLGLGQFVRIFQGRSVDKFQLVNLTMKKLKDMGADAVGPRRKLMHAIDCLCQPYCFGAV